MSKIYNEIIIDMNPESSTFEETLSEDSFEYSGDMMLMQDNLEANAPPSTQPEAQAYLTRAGRNAIKYNGKYYYYYADGFKEIDPATAQGFGEENYLDVTEKMKDYTTSVGDLDDYGMAEMTEDQWMAMTQTQQAQYILDTKYGAEGAWKVDMGDGVWYTLNDVLEDLKSQPLAGVIDPEKAGFLEEQYGGPGPDGIVGTDDDITFAESLTGVGKGLTRDAAKEAYQLGLGTAEQTYELGVSGAERDLGTMLGGLQEQAYQVAPAASTGVGIRAQMRGRKKIGEGFETGMGGYRDVMAGLEGTWGRAQAGLEGTWGRAKDVYDLAERQAATDYTKGMYDLGITAEGEWESNWTNFLNTLPPAVGD